MKNDIRLYGNTVNPEVLKDLRKINEQIDEASKKEEVDKEEMLKLRMQRLYRGMEINTGLNTRPWGGYFPY